MSDKKAGKLELLVRRNKGRVEYPYYATELSHILKVKVGPADVLDLEATDRLFAQHLENSTRSSMQADFSFKKAWKHEPVTDWLRACQCLGERLRGERAVLFAGPYEFCGGVRVDPERALKAAVDLLSFDQNTLRLQTDSADYGLLSDIYQQT